MSSQIKFVITNFGSLKRKSFFRKYKLWWLKEQGIGKKALLIPNSGFHPRAPKIDFAEEDIVVAKYDNIFPVYRKDIIEEFYV